VTVDDRSTVREVLGDVRIRRRKHATKTTVDRLTDAYLGAFLALYAVSAVAWLFDVDLSGTSFSFQDTLAWLPVILFLGMWAVVRFGTWQGPVVFSGPEMQWVVSAPLSRKQLVLGRLRRAIVVAVAVGVLGGLLVTLVAATMTDVGRVGVFLNGSASLIAVSLIAVSLSWHVERSARWSALVILTTPLMLVVAALLAFGVATGYEVAVTWSGPWGWASASSIAATGGHLVGLWVQSLLLAVAAVVAVTSAVLTSDRASDEELWRRAEVRSSAAAAMFFGDVRTLRTVARRSRARGHVRGRDLRLLRPARPWLVVVSWDVLTLRRDPSRVVAAVILAAGGFVAAVAATGRSILALVAFLFLYAAGSRLVEPIRVEVGQPNAHRMLPWKWGTVLALHCIAPVVVLTVLGWIGLGVVAASGFVDGVRIGELFFVVPFAAGALVLPSAIAAARQPFPVGTIVGGGDAGPVLALLWLLVGPALAAVAVSISFGGLQRGMDGDPSGFVSAMFVLGGACAAFGAWLATRKNPS
jgi:hypothetical protein